MRIVGIYIVCEFPWCLGIRVHGFVNNLHVIPLNWDGLRHHGGEPRPAAFVVASTMSGGLQHLGGGISTMCRYGHLVFAMGVEAPWWGGAQAGCFRGSFHNVL